MKFQTEHPISLAHVHNISRHYGLLPFTVKRFWLTIILSKTVLLRLSKA